jgi:hypothetical protein
VSNSWGYQLAITDAWEVLAFGRYSICRRRLKRKYPNELRELLTDGGATYLNAFEFFAKQDWDTALAEFQKAYAGGCTAAKRQVEICEVTYLDTSLVDLFPSF